MNLCKEYVSGAQIKTPGAVAKYCSDFRTSDREHFIVLGLNAAKKVIYKDIVSIGTLDACIAEPREIFKAAIAKSAHAIITVHNHPSGNSTPSKEDNAIWQKLNAAGELLCIRVVDNVIVTQDSYYSDTCKGQPSGAEAEAV